MCHSAVHRYVFQFDSIPDKYKTQEVCNLVVSWCLSLVVYSPYK